MTARTNVTQDVTITVTNINEAPVATMARRPASKVISGQLPATDIDSPSLTYRWCQARAWRAHVHTDGTFSYTADLGFRGPTLFSFKAMTARIDSNVATFDLNVTQLHSPVRRANDT